jgi:hypothetical protein
LFKGKGRTPFKPLVTRKQRLGDEACDMLELANLLLFRLTIAPGVLSHCS